MAECPVKDCDLRQTIKDEVMPQIKDIHDYVVGEKAKKAGFSMAIRNVGIIVTITATICGGLLWIFSHI